MSADGQTSHRRNLTDARRRLRQLHRATNPRRELEYRNHRLQREPSDQTQSGCYRILNPDGEFLDAIEPSDFVYADDWVRYIDLVIQHDRETARDWRDRELSWTDPQEADTA